MPCLSLFICFSMSLAVKDPDTVCIYSQEYGCWWSNEDHSRDRWTSRYKIPKHACDATSDKKLTSHKPNLDSLAVGPIQRYECPAKSEEPWINTENIDKNLTSKRLAAGTKTSSVENLLFSCSSNQGFFDRPLIFPFHFHFCNLFPLFVACAKVNLGRGVIFYPLRMMISYAFNEKFE